MRIDLDELLTMYAEAPVSERSNFSPRAVLEIAMGISIIDLTITQRRINLTVSRMDADTLTCMSRPVLVRNGLELAIFTVGGKKSEDGSSVLEVVFAAKTLLAQPGENQYRDAAQIAFELLASSDRFQRYNGPRDQRTQEQVVRVTPVVDPNSVVVVEESRDRLAYLEEQRLGQCKPEPKRSVRLDSTRHVYTDRETIRKVG